MNNIFKVTVTNGATWTGEVVTFVQGQTREQVDTAVWGAVNDAKTEQGWATAAFSIQQFYNQNEVLEELGKFPLWNGLEAANIWVPREA